MGNAKSLNDFFLESMKNSPDFNQMDEIQKEQYADDIAFSEQMRYDQRIKDLENHFYNTLSKLEKARWESSIKAVFDEINKDEYARHLSKIDNKLSEISALFENIAMTDNEKDSELLQEKKSSLKVLLKTKFGRELVQNYQPEVFLRLFDFRDDIIIFNNENVPLVNNTKEFSTLREETEECFVNLKAIEEYISPSLLKSPQLHLKDVTISELYYDAIIQALIEEGIINAQSHDTHVYVKHKEFNLEDLAHFINSLYANGFIKYQITRKQGIIISKNTFNKGYATGFANQNSSGKTIHTRLRNRINFYIQTHNNSHIK